MTSLERRLGDAAATTAWNAKRKSYLDALAEGRIPDGAELIEGGWWVVSRHKSGVNSAYVCLNRLRRLYPTLQLKVANTVDDPVDWNAQIIAKGPQ